MATLYITSTANTGTGTLRTLASSAAAGDVIQPSPTLFPKGTPCNVSITSAFGILQNQTIQGGQTRLVITSTSTLSHGNSSNKPSYVNYTDVDFRGLTASSGGAIVSQYCYAHTFLRCTFCGISGYTAPIVLYSTTAPTTTFRDCAFYGNRATQNSSGAQGAIYHNADSVAAKTSLINCTFGANYRNYSSSPRTNWNRTVKEQTNIVNTVAQEADWKTPPASSYGYSSWSKTAYQSMDPRPSATASWRTGATSTSSTVDLDGNARRSNGALGAYEYYIGKLATPTGLAATSVTASSITLSWNSVTNATWYRVVVASADSSTTSTVSGTSTTITGLNSNTTYLCTVIATADYYLDSDGTSCSATTSASGTRLAAPTILNHSCGANGLTLTFADESGNAVGFRIDVLVGGSVVATSTINSGSATSGTVQYSGFTYGTTYLIHLTALADPNNTRYQDSDPASANITWTYQQKQLDPFNSSTLKVQDKNDSGTASSDYLTSTTVRIVYYNSDSDFSSVKFKYRVAGGTWSSEYSTTNPPSGITCGRYTSGYWNGWGWIEITGLTPGTAYEFIAQAVASSGSGCLPSVYSDALEFTTVAATQLATPTINGFPRASGATMYTTLQIRLSATIEHATTYEYQIATNSTFTTGLLTRTSATVSSGYPMSGYFTGLTSGTRYYCRARALSSDSAYATSEWSATSNTYVTSDLATPVVTVSSVTQTSATLSWGAVANRSSYTVKWRAVGASTWNQTTGLTATSKAITGLTLGTTYEYEVYAVGNGTTFITSSAATGTFTTVALITLDTPTNLASSNITNNSATVSWSGDDRATQFKVEYRASGASTWEEKIVTA